MKLHRIRSFAEYTLHRERIADEFARRQAVEQALSSRSGDFTVAGYSYPARRCVEFAVTRGSNTNVNWRETLLCPITGFNNRVRATLHIIDIEASPYPRSRIYISEQVTPLHRFLAERYEVTGSEYLGSRCPLGATNASGVRNEDLSRLTFEDGCFDYVISLDCFEHFPDYRAAFRESARVLAPGGTMVWSVPFTYVERNLIRARQRPDGTIEHLMPPEYHGDPINSDGCLCFTVFGWEHLRDVREAGFADAYAVMVWSQASGYLGGEQIVFVARK